MAFAKPQRTPPPALDFPDPVCPLCEHTVVEIRRRDAFRCEHCRCSWDVDTAHLFPGEWDAPELGEEVA